MRSAQASTSIATPMAAAGGRQPQSQAAGDPTGPLADGWCSSQTAAPVSAAAMMIPATAYGRTRVSMPCALDRRM